MKYALIYVTICEKSVADVLDTIIVWPEKQTTKEKRKQSVEHTPSVIMSDKQIKIMQTKVNGKKTKRRGKELKKQKE